MSSLKDRLAENQKPAEDEGVWTPTETDNSKIRDMERGAAQVAISIAPFWGFATGKGGARVRLYAPTFILACFTLMVVIASIR